MGVRLVSILMPVYNEEESVAASLHRVLAAPLPEGVASEVIAVDDGSTDGSAEVVEALARQHADRVRLLRHGKNRGKGAAIRTALSQARGEFVLIQDSDLEYDPRDYPSLLAPLLEGRADAVYGTRFAVGGERRVLYFWHSLANRFFTGLVNLAADLNLTDVWTCYKVFRTSLLRSIPIRSDRFSFEVEITIKLAQRQVAIYETPIRYHGRTYEEGKKIGKLDVLAGLIAVLRFALVRDIYTDHGPEILDTLASARRFNRWMADTIAPYVGARVLEIGAGIGNLSRCLAPRRLSYWASDIDEEHLARLRQRLAHRANFQARRVDLADPASFLEIDGAVDTVVCLNVLEHVEDDRQGLLNIRRSLAPGGRAIILVPQGMSLYGELDKVLGHCRRYSREELARKVKDAGFAIETIFDFNRITVPGWYVNGRLLRRRRFSRLQLAFFDRMVWLWRLLDGYLPWRGVSLIVVARKL